MKKLEAAFSCICFTLAAAAAALLAAGMTGPAFVVAWGGTLLAWLAYALCVLLLRRSPGVEDELRGQSEP